MSKKDKKFKKFKKQLNKELDERAIEGALDFIQVQQCLIDELLTKNKVLAAELELVPYQLKQQRELCAEVYEYWSLIFDIQSGSISIEDIRKHIMSSIKNAHTPTPDDLARPNKNNTSDEDGRDAYENEGEQGTDAFGK